MVEEKARVDITVLNDGNQAYNVEDPVPEAQRTTTHTMDNIAQAHQQAPEELSTRNKKKI